MKHHEDLGNNLFTRSRKLYQLILEEKVTFAGNRRLKIYGKLDCSSGKKIRPGNRVFFTNEAEAVSYGYRPCGHCMRAAYQVWKTKQDERTSNSG